jgi:hypothetical protein
MTARAHAARKAALARFHGPGSPAVAEADQALREAKLADRIRELADAAPPLSPAQRSRLALLLMPQE